MTSDFETKRDDLRPDEFKIKLFSRAMVSRTVTHKDGRQCKGVPPPTTRTPLPLPQFLPGCPLYLSLLFSPTCLLNLSDAPAFAVFRCCCCCCSCWILHCCKPGWGNALTTPLLHHVVVDATRNPSAKPLRDFIIIVVLVGWFVVFPMGAGQKGRIVLFEVEKVWWKL